MTSTPARKSSREALSRSSALNERYFEVEKARSRSLDNLLSEPEPNPFTDLGLSQSRLNDRYHSVEQLAPIKPVIANSGYMSKQEAEFEYPDVSSVSTSNRGGPRYIKSHYAGKKAPPGSHSSRAQIEKNEFGVRSSAMSDTSEAPSLASHVRRVRVPSQASDVDQFLDELFSPVLDGNLDELSDARSLAASIKGGADDVIEGLDEYLEEMLIPALPTLDMSDATFIAKKIKGGGHRDRANSQGSSVLDQEVETLTSGGSEQGVLNSNTSVDDYISDLFKPIFINDSLKTLTEKHNLVDSIKGGGATHTPNAAGTSSYNFPAITTPIVSPQPLMVPMLGSPQEGLLPFFNVPGLPLPPNGTDMAAYQQNLQRAFLQSAMAQNIQIQQQLLAQNQALQQLLTQQATDVTKTVTTETTVRASVETSKRKPSFSTRKTSSSPSNNSSMVDFKTRKTSTESNLSMMSRNGVPPPPPMPPPLDGTDPSETRPFMDPYGRAKTVRIGKWRWPPPKDGSNPENGEDFMHFKMRQNQRKVTPSKEQNVVVTNGHANNKNANISVQVTTKTEWEEVDFEPMVREERLTKSNSKRSFDIGASRPSPGSIGKLKLSSEMKQRLEMVTANHSVRSTSSKVEKPSRAINKLEETRKKMLERELTGRWGEDSPDSNSESPSPETTPKVSRFG